MSTDLRKGFHSEIEEIREGVTRLAASVIEAIPRATDVLLDSDLEGADYMLQADREIDTRSLELEERCYQVLALQAPVASDLRHIIAVVKMIPEIERSGDLAVNICKAARRIYGHDLDPRLRGTITRMSEQAQQLFRFAIDAYVESDVPLASAIGDMDDMLDRLHAEFIQQIFESHAGDKLDLQVAVQLALVARFYERIGDHAVNIGGRVRYMVTGWLPSHEGSMIKVRSSIEPVSAEDDETPTAGTSPATEANDGG
jgi:phosphate transport system protein